MVRRRLEFAQTITTWLFVLEGCKKRLIQIIFDGFVASITVLQTFFMRLEATDFLYRIETFVGVLIHVVFDHDIQSFTERLSEGQASGLLRQDVAIVKHAVIRHINAQFTNSQFDALVSFTFNLWGTAKFDHAT